MSNTAENQEKCVNHIKQIFPQLKDVNIWGEPGVFFLVSSENSEDVKICNDYLFGPSGIRDSVADHLNRELEMYGFFWECKHAGCYVAVYDDLATMNTPVSCLNTDNSCRIDCMNTNIQDFYHSIIECPF